jgi:hypothetical protein
VQGKLRNETLDFDIESACACCGRAIRFRMHQDLTFAVEDAECDPLFFFPLVDPTRLRAPNIIDDF